MKLDTVISVALALHTYTLHIKLCIKLFKITKIQVAYATLTDTKHSNLKLHATAFEFLYSLCLNKLTKDANSGKLYRLCCFPVEHC